MQRSVIYNIIEDEDRHLRGKIAELIFERVKPHLFSKNLNCCSTLDLWWFLNYGLHPIKVEDLKLYDEKSLQLSYMRVLNNLRELLGLGSHKKLSSLLLNENIRKSLEKLCLICLKKGNTFIHGPNHNYHFYLCNTCFNICREHHYIEGDIVSVKDAKFQSLIENLAKMTWLMKYLEVVKILSKLSDEDRAFLWNIYKASKASPGQHPFDYICVDDEGNKYLIDVTSVRGKGLPAKLSRSEMEICILAESKGFKVLVPVVKFLENWQVEVMLTEF